MIEHEPNPEAEPEPIVLTCWKCEHTVKATQDNTMSFYYSKQNYFDNTQLICNDTCGAINVAFHDIVDGVGEAAPDYPCTFETYCDEEVILELRHEMMGVKDFIPVQLSVRQINQLDKLGQYLQSITVDASDFVTG